MNDKLYSPSTNFSSVRDGRNSPDFYFDVDLTNARNINSGTALILNVAGNSFYCDANPTDGNAVVKFQDTNLDRVSTPFYASPGFIANIPFTQILIENAAQPGKKLRIVYGVDVDFQPGSVAQIAVSNAGGFTAVRPEAPTGSYIATGAVGVNTPDTLFTPGANINGAILLSAYFSQYSGAAAGEYAFVSHTAAPANLTTGEHVLGMGIVSTTSGGNIVSSAMLPTAQYIPAGKGLYFIGNAITSGLAGNSYRSARYKIL